MGVDRRNRWAWIVTGLWLLAPGPSEAAPGDLRLEVDRSERALRVYRGGALVAQHPVAVGQPRYPTPTGSFTIHQVVWNPAWNPPDSDWARGASYKPPGDPANPMGRAKLVFRAPYTIHGTDALDSLGTAASHGSIRLANAVIVELAPMVMEAGGAPRSAEWIANVQADRTTTYTVDLPEPVPLTIRE